MVKWIEKLQRYFREQKYKNEKEIFIKEQDQIFDVLSIVNSLHQGFINVRLKEWKDNNFPKKESLSFFIQFIISSNFFSE